MDDEAEEAYISEADYYEEDEEYEDEIEEEEDDEEKEELEEEPEIDYEAEIEEAKEEIYHPIIQKINETDNNHRIIKIRPKDQYRSSHIIHFPEMVEAIGIRVTQIEHGAPILTDVSGYTSPISMAKKEFIDRQNPLILNREMKVEDNEIEVEEWPVREMTFPISDKEILDISETQIIEMLSGKKKEKQEEPEKKEAPKIKTKAKK